MNLPEPALAIDSHPLAVSPDVPLLDVLTKMNQIRGSQCTLFDETGANNEYEQDKASVFANNFSNYEVNSCALVIEKDQIKGIVTERDVVKFVATKQNLELPISAVMTKQVITLNQSEFGNMFVALSLMGQHQIRHLPIVDDRGKLVGIVTGETVRRVLQPVNLLAMRRVADVMATQVIHASVSTSVLSIARLMADYQVSCVVITHLQRINSHTPILIPIGIVTERDIVQLQILGLDMEHIEAETVMSQPVFCLRPEDSLWVAHQEMQQHFVRRLVVIGKQGELVGIITQTNIMRSLDPVELYSVVKTLQQVVEERTTQLSKANQKLQIQAEEVREALHKQQELNALKTQFISMVSHEFRNPLTCIIGLVDLLANSDHALSAQTQSRYLSCILDAANNMLKMVENMLLISRADHGKLEIDAVPIDLLEFSQELLWEIQFSNAGSHSLTFSYQGEKNLIVCLDKNLLRHILTNLLSNALKYSPGGSKVSLDLYVEAERAIFQVRDGGIGIPLDAQQRLFESFHRAGNVGDIPGTGLGLTIVKRYVDLLNGQINVKSEVGVGTTFTVTLPLKN